jgi:hypothetical protein
VVEAAVEEAVAVEVEGAHQQTRGSSREEEAKVVLTTTSSSCSSASTANSIPPTTKWKQHPIVVGSPIAGFTLKWTQQSDPMY